MSNQFATLTAVLFILHLPALCQGKTAEILIKIYPLYAQKSFKNKVLTILAIKSIIPVIPNGAGFEEFLHPVLLESNISDMSRIRQKNTRSTPKSGIGPGRLASGKKLPVLLIAAVCAIVLAAHWPALSAKALSFDDYDYLTGNMLVQNPGWTSAWRFLTEVLEPSSVQGYYQPLAMISLMFDYALGGREKNLLPFHRTSLILHTANTALIIILLYLLFGQPWIAAGVGLLFGVHPMTVETIPWVGERKTLLAAFFSLWSLIFYVYSRTTHHTQRTTTLLYIGSFLTYLLALMSKPTSVPLPAVMLLLDYWPLRRFSRQSISEKLPFFMIGIVSAVITYVSQTLTGATTMPGKLGLRHITLVLCHNIVFYLYKILWPVNLSSHYAFPKPMVLSNPTLLAAVIGTCILIPLLLFSLRWTRAALTGWLIFFVAIFPTMGVIGFTVVIAADKFAYLPSIGLLMMLASFLGWFCIPKRRAAATALVILALTSAEVVATRNYLSHWRDSTSLGEYMLSLTPDSAQVHDSLAGALQSQGKLDEAITHYRKALQVRPHDALVYNDLGAALLAKKDVNEAIACYRKAVNLLPDFAEAYYNLANALQAQGDSNQAIYNLRKAISFKPDYADAHNNLGILLSKQGRFDDAITHFQKAARLKSDNAQIHANLGDALQLKGRLDEAADHYRKALHLKPDDADICIKLGVTLEALRKPCEAISLYRQAMSLKPDWPLPLNGLAWILATYPDPNVRDAKQAIELAERAAAMTKHQDAIILNTLAAAYAAAGRFSEATATAQKALDIAKASRNDQLADFIRRQLEMYKQGKFIKQ